MRTVKLWLLVGIACLSVIAAAPQKRGMKSRLSAYRSNSCVTCHATLSDPLRVSASFYEWFGSTHEQQGVGCEKCHGGNPAAKEMSLAHQGVVRAALPPSTLHPRNLPQTCGACHQQVVKSFTGSQHYQTLQSSGAGPSCTTCHQHMATAVITWPPETAALCANCHHPSGTAPRSAGVPAQAGEAIAAFSRADEVIEWTHFLIAEEKRGANAFKAETAQLQRLAALSQSAKLSFHEFDLAKSRQQADQVFTAATKIKNNLGK